MNQEMHCTSPAPLPCGGVVLAGGESRRMGRPKAWLPVGPGTMLRTVVESVHQGLTLSPPARGSGNVPAAAPVIVVGAPGQVLPPLPGWVVVTRDEIPGQGPLRGLAAGLAALQGWADAAYVSSCDAPLLRPAFVARMLELLDDVDVAVPLIDGRHHTLAAAYRVSVLPVVRELLAAGKRRPVFLYESVRTRAVSSEKLRDVDPGLVSLRNVNSQEDYRRLREAAGGSGRAPTGGGTIRARPDGP